MWALQTPRCNQNSRNSSSTCGIFATSRLSRLASVRVHADVRNGHGRARGVGAVPRRRRSNEAIFDREFQFRESHTSAETKRTPDQIPDTKEGFYIYLCTQRNDNTYSIARQRKAHQVQQQCETTQGTAVRT